VGNLVPLGTPQVRATLCPNPSTAPEGYVLSPCEDRFLLRSNTAVGYASDPNSPGPDRLSIMLAIGVVGLVGVVGYATYAWKKNEDRLAKLPATERHQERMDQLAESVAYAAVSGLMFP
jgi:hypothetical protein